MKFLASLALVAAVASADDQLPIAVFHGMGDACIYPGMHSFAKQLGKKVGAYSKCVEVGNGTITSLLDSFDD